MKSKIIVFDFDKTLTYSDTLFGFFQFLGKKNYAYPLKVLLYFFVMVLTKLKVFSNTNLKQIGINIFLKGILKQDLNSSAEDYSKTIKLNNLYDEFDFISKNSIYVVSASFTNYLRPLFPKNVTVFGSEFLFKNERIIGLSFNCFGFNKAKILVNNGVNKIDLLYTDSYSDLSLAKIARKIIIISRDKSFECNDIETFKSYFSKK